MDAGARDVRSAARRNGHARVEDAGRAIERRRAPSLISQSSVRPSQTTRQRRRRNSHPAFPASVGSHVIATSPGPTTDETSERPAQQFSHVSTWGMPPQLSPASQQGRPPASPPPPSGALQTVSRSPGPTTEEDGTVPGQHPWHVMGLEWGIPPQLSPKVQHGSVPPPPSPAPPPLSMLPFPPESPDPAPPPSRSLPTDSSSGLHAGTDADAARRMDHAKTKDFIEHLRHTKRDDGAPPRVRHSRSGRPRRGFAGKVIARMAFVDAPLAYDGGDGGAGRARTPGMGRPGRLSGGEPEKCWVRSSGASGASRFQARSTRTSSLPGASRNFTPSSPFRRRLRPARGAWWANLAAPSQTRSDADHRARCQSRLGAATGFEASSIARASGAGVAGRGAASRVPRRALFVQASLLVDRRLAPERGVRRRALRRVGPSSPRPRDRRGLPRVAARDGRADAVARGRPAGSPHLRARACYDVFDAKLDLGPCLGGGVEWITAHGFGALPDQPSNATGFLGVGSLGGRGLFRISSRFAVRLVGEAVVPSTRPQFVIDGRGGVFQTPVASLRVALGVEVHF